VLTTQRRARERQLIDERRVLRVAVDDRDVEAGGLDAARIEVDTEHVDPPVEQLVMSVDPKRPRPTTT
jgi:hypothetical protein